MQDDPADSRLRYRGTKVPPLSEKNLPRISVKKSRPICRNR